MDIKSDQLSTNTKKLSKVLKFLVVDSLAIPQLSQKEHP